MTVRGHPIGMDVTDSRPSTYVCMIRVGARIDTWRSRTALLEIIDAVYLALSSYAISIVSHDWMQLDRWPVHRLSKCDIDIRSKLVNRKLVQLLSLSRFQLWAYCRWLHRELSGVDVCFTAVALLSSPVWTRWTRPLIECLEQPEDFGQRLAELGPCPTLSPTCAVAGLGKLVPRRVHCVLDVRNRQWRGLERVDVRQGVIGAPGGVGGANRNRCRLHSRGKGRSADIIARQSSP
jgi:hypothetical protein